MKVSQHYRTLFSRNRNRGLVIDSNLILLLVVGSLSRDYIGQFKRTRKFDGDDFDLMTEVLGFFSKVLVSPNILTEVSNLLGHLDEGRRRGAFAVLSRKLKLLSEVYVPSSDASANEIYAGLGLTDSGILELGRRRALVLTDDFPLSFAIRRLGVAVVNYNDIRYS